MNKHRINLLPAQRVAALEQVTLVRFGVTVCVGIAIAALIGSLLLVPVRLMLHQAILEKEGELASLQTASTTSDRITIGERLDRLLKNVAAVKALSGSGSASTALRNVLEIPREGIVLTGLTYTPSQPSTLIVTGVAATRDNLHDYQAALQRAAFVRASQLPVSSYAKNMQVPFTITLTLSL